MESNRLPLPRINNHSQLLTSVDARPSAPFYKSRPILARNQQVPLSTTFLHKVDLPLPLDNLASSMSRLHLVPNNCIPKLHSSCTKLNDIGSISQPPSKHFGLSIYSPNRFLTHISHVDQKRSIPPLETIALERIKDYRIATLSPVKKYREVNTIHIPLLPEKAPCPFYPCQLPPTLPALAPLPKTKSKRNTKLHVFSVSIPDFTAESRNSKHTFPILYHSIPHFRELKVQRCIAYQFSQIRIDMAHYSRLNNFRFSSYKSRVTFRDRSNQSDLTSNELYVLGVSYFKQILNKPFCYTSIPFISPFTPFINTNPILIPLYNSSSESCGNISPSPEESLPFVLTEANNEKSFGSPVLISSDNSYLESNHLSLFKPFSLESCSSHDNLLPFSSGTYTVPSDSHLYIRTPTNTSNRSQLNSNDSSSTRSTTDKSITSSITNLSLTNFGTNIPISNSPVPITHPKFGPSLLSNIQHTKPNTLESLNVHPTSARVLQKKGPNTALFKPSISPKQTQDLNLLKELLPDNKISRNMKFPGIVPCIADKKFKLRFKDVPVERRVSGTSFNDKDVSSRDSKRVIHSKEIQPLNDMTILEDCDHEYFEIQRRNKIETLSQKLEYIMNNQTNNELSSNMQELDVAKELEFESQNACNNADTVPPNRIDSKTGSKNKFVDKLSPTFANEFVDELVLGIDFYNLITHEHPSESQVNLDGDPKDHIDCFKSSSKAVEKELRPKHFHCPSTRHSSFVTGDLKFVKDQLRVNHKMRLIMENAAKRKLMRRRLGNGLTDLFNITHAYTYSYYPSDLFSFEELSSDQYVDS